ncbi:CPBP family intramembrane glutamic endopeptidase [Galbibacter sp.]|jgi:membrane protease YdiL (CAAX protease family)|uniref:CPBP family intramembrane glutamic endopeptidase n=1 Tax=Galbibacter sp. TaxID=2918471 RepID=UPI003A8CB46C
MYIEQGYRGQLGLWKYLVIPTGFIGLIIINYITVLNTPQSTEEIMQIMVERLGSNLVLITMLLPLAIALFLLWIWVKLIHQQSITSLTTSRKKVDWKRIFFSFFLWGGITALFVVVDYYFNPQDYIWNFDLVPFLSLVVIAILLVPLQTSFEEYLFRGYLMQGIGIFAKNRWVPLVVTSVIFGLMHIANPEVEKLGYGIMIYYIGTGFFLGVITLMDEGMELALGFHAANNLVTVLLVTATWTAFQTESVLKDVSTPALGYDVLVPVLVVFPILIFIFSKKYKWSQWKERLTGAVEKAKLNLES